MKNIFKENLKLTEEEIKYVFENGFIVLDTNVLINLYRYSSQNRESFIEILKQLKSRLYLPYQVGWEFFQNRLDEINAQKDTYSNAISNIEKLKEEFNNKNRNPFLEEKKLNFLDDIINDLKKEKDNFDNIRSNDTILSEILDLFDNCIGKEPIDKNLETIFSEGKLRYSKKIPPGYKDEAKPEELRKFGDLIIWLDIIEKAKELKKPCLFITDDKKEDWWLLDKHNNIILPRPELRKEFFIKTENIYYSYLPFNFLNKIKDYLNVTVEESLINEVKDNSIKSYNEYLHTDVDINYTTNYSTDINKRIYLIEELIPNAIYNFVKELQIFGYECFYDKANSSNSFYLTCILPDIFDIERKFDNNLYELLKYHAVKVIKKIM